MQPGLISGLMRLMETDRRYMLKGAAAALLLPWARHAAKAAGQDPLFAAAYRRDDGGFGAALFDQAGDRKSSVALPGRGHGFAIDALGRRVVTFARRPGKFAVSMGMRDMGEPVWFAPPEGRHFYGHGVFSADGRILYATENDIESGRGLIGLYDNTGNFAPIGAFPTGGTGPHDLALMPDGQTLVVANGGIRTHPDHGREMLNLDKMAPSLVYLDTRNGNIIDQAKLAPDLHKLSLRHLAVNDHGQVVIGCQHKGPRNERPELILTHSMGAAPQLLTLPDEATQSLNNYVSSVALDTSGRYAAITSSKGGAVLIIDLEQRKLIKQQRIRDVSGVAATPDIPGGFLVTSGTSTIGQIGLNEAEARTVTSGVSWDNHVVWAS